MGHWLIFSQEFIYECKVQTLRFIFIFPWAYAVVLPEIGLLWNM